MFRVEFRDSSGLKWISRVELNSEESHEATWPGFLVWSEGLSTWGALNTQMLLASCFESISGLCNDATVRLSVFSELADLTWAAFQMCNITLCWDTQWFYPDGSWMIHFAIWSVWFKTIWSMSLIKNISCPNFIFKKSSVYLI